MDSEDKSCPRRVLVVDDEACVISVATRILEQLGYSVRSTDTAEEALRVLGAERFDVVLMYVELPGMTGFQALNHLRKVSSAPIILMTGHADAEFLKDSLLLGAKCLLRKPFQPSELEKCLAGLS